MCQLSTLEAIDVSNNLLSLIPYEFITNCGKVPGLRTLNFSRNRLVGEFPNFVGFQKLEILDFYKNKLTGKINSQLSDLISLRVLDLGFNSFTGSVPTQFGKSFLLEELYLSVNKFSGKIGEEIANYSKLVTLDLSGNMLVGYIPDRFGELSKLETFILSSNNLDGEIPKFLSNIQTLKRFSANLNQFSGTVPSGLTEFVNSLDLSFNNMSGSIPFDLLAPSNLQSVDLSNNKLNGPMPGNISSSLFRVRLGYNSLSGKIPSLAFENFRNLTYLELENNDFIGSIPKGLGLCNNLALLNLANNKLSGVLPLELGKLTNLQELKLESNNFVGEIPISIAQMHSLREMNISWNFLNGSIPASFSKLKNLTNLDLSCNNLSGFIPESISSLGSLIELELGDNQLSGEIPLMPQNLQISLNLSGNSLRGLIPDKLSMLNQLEILDLSNNRFSGPIPISFVKMMSLTILDLSDNFLSGVIPKFPSYVSVDLSGNNNLKNATANPTQPLRRKGKSVAMGIIVLVVAAVFIAFAIVTTTAILVYKSYYKPKEQQIESHEDLSESEIMCSAILTSNPIHRSSINFRKAMETVIERSRIVLKTKFSTYYKATMPSGASYFVKNLNWAENLFQEGNYYKFGDELQILSKLSNTNIMTPLAYVLTINNAYIFYEYFRMGTLFDALHNKIMGEALDWASRYSIAIGMAQGMAYLHGCNSGPILLLDLSSTSVLLKSHKEPKIGDIELWKVIDPMKNTTSSLSAVAGTVGYIPPEYAYTMRVTMAGNVYSLGVILLELLTGRPAVSGGTELAKWGPLISPEKYKELDHILDNNISRTSVAVKNQMLAVLKVALACVSGSPDARPRTKSIVRMLLHAR